MGAYEHFPYSNFHDLNLDWLLEQLKRLIEHEKEHDKIIDQILERLKHFDVVDAEIKELQDLLEKIKNGDYVDLYLDSIINWIDKNLQILVSRIVKYVSFGLTGNGYFVAYIPPTWDFIQFDTLMDFNNPMYGHLVLRW